MTPWRMAWTSASLFLLPVIKLRCLGTGGVEVMVAMACVSLLGVDLMIVCPSTERW